jgi:hypothetical protein
MTHAVALQRAARTAECARKSLELDNGFASLEADNIELLRTGRDAVARSHRFIRDINERNGKWAASVGGRDRRHRLEHAGAISFGTSGRFVPYLSSEAG